MKRGEGRALWLRRRQMACVIDGRAPQFSAQPMTVDTDLEFAEEHIARRIW
jgi:hypothetical protein